MVRNVIIASLLLVGCGSQLPVSAPRAGMGAVIDTTRPAAQREVVDPGLSPRLDLSRPSHTP